MEKQKDLEIDGETERYRYREMEKQKDLQTDGETKRFRDREMQRQIPGMFWLKTH